jgi:hypothetical protein
MSKTKTKKKVPNSTKAKHVLGGLTLKDILPLVSECSVITLVDELGEESNWMNFSTDADLELWDSFNDDSPVWSFCPKTKVKVKGDHIELYARMGDMKMYFNRLSPIKIKIL